MKIDFLEDEKLSFGLESPVSSISLPREKTIFFAWHGVSSQGTIYMCRSDDNKQPRHLNFNLFSVNSDMAKTTPSAESEYYGKYHRIEKFEDTAALPRFLRYNKFVEDKIANFFKNS